MVLAAAAEDELVPLTTIQKITGRRMLESSQGIPSVTEHTRADVTSLLAMRAQINEDGAHRLTINDFVLLAVVRALGEHRRMNAVFQGDSLLYKGSIHLGMAVATPRGLLVPVIRDADHYSLSGSQPGPEIWQRTHGRGISPLMSSVDRPSVSRTSA